MKKLILPLLALILLSASANTGWISLGGSPGMPPEITILDDGPEGTTIDFQIPGYYLDTLYIEGDPYSAITLPEAVTFFDQGWPQLPKISESIIIPDDAQMSYQILESEYVDGQSLPVVSSKGSILRTVDPDTIPHTFSDFYQTDTWWPEGLVELHQPFILRDFRGITLQFNPFQHNAVQKSLLVCKQLVVKVYPDGPGEVNVKTKSRDSISKEFSDIYANFFLNFSEAKWDTIAEVGRMLIIVADNFYDSMLPLVDWKMKKGIETTLVKCSDVGMDSAAVKAYIQNEYDTEGVTFVLLVGDGDPGDVPNKSVPYSTGTEDVFGPDNDVIADPVYTYLEGYDWYPDAFISRFSANQSVHADNQVARSIDYERYPQLGADWHHKGTGIAQKLGPDTTRCNWLREKLLDYTYTWVDKIYEDSGGYEIFRALINEALNDGRSIVNFIGEGSWSTWSFKYGPTVYTNSDVLQLNNNSMLPFIISVACRNGAFVGRTCFAENWLRAGSAENPVGAVAFYGSSYLQTWYEPYIGQAAAVDLLTQDRMNTVGGILFNGSCIMISELALGGVREFQPWHIFGDASVQVRTDTPQPLVVSHPHFYKTEPGSFTVNTGVPDAMVCLWKENETYHQTKFTDAGGQATFNTNLSTTGPLYVTVTKYNHIPYEALVVSGSLSESATWPTNVFIFGDVTVPVGVSLNLNEGSTVKFDTTDAETGGADPGRCELEVQGTLIAEGTASEPIVLTSNAEDPHSGDWYGIRFLDSSVDSACVVQNCQISYAYVGISFDQTSPQISQNQISGCEHGVHCYNASPEISANEISSCAYGLICQDQASPEVNHNMLHDISPYGIYCYPECAPEIVSDTLIGKGSSNSCGIHCLDSSPRISGGLIENFECGINCCGGDPIISGVNVVDNIQYGIACNLSGYPPPLGNCAYSAPTITENTIQGSEYGLYMGASAEAHIDNNTIFDNQLGIRSANSTSVVFRNIIRQNDSVGVYCSGSHLPILGDLSNADSTDDGYNDIWGNQVFDVLNEASDTVQAENNWWGPDSLDSSQFSGLVDYDPAREHSSDSTAPVAITDLSINLIKVPPDSGIVLSWSEITMDVAGKLEFISHYVIYRDNTHDYEPTSSESLAVVPDTTYEYFDTGAVDSTGLNYYYLVKAVDYGTNKSDDSNMVGEFDIYLSQDSKDPFEE